MIKFMESALGRIIARNGVLAIILAFSLYMNHVMVDRLFTLIEKQTEVSTKVLRLLEELKAGKVSYVD